MKRGQVCMVKKYNIGLDIGDASVGWAITGENGHLVKRKGKNMWGVSLYDKGETAAARRGYRSSRRRQERRKQRIRQLQKIFAEEISKLDGNFFTRLKESFLHSDDSSILSMSILFDDKNYSDKKYYKEYPTIYHLRRELLNSQEKVDLRLVYIAIHHILKYRGNFLFGRADLTEFKNDLSDNLKEAFYKLFNEEYTLTDQTMFEVLTILASQNSRNVKQDLLHNALLIKNKEIDVKIKEVIKAILGYKFNLGRLFEIEEIDEGIKSMTFRDEFDEDKIGNLLVDKTEIFMALQSIFNWTVLEELVGDVGSNNPDDKTISNAMVVKFENHKMQLKMLKELIRDVCTKKDYHRVFRRENQETNYTNYIKNISKNNYFLDKSSGHTLDKFNLFIKKTLDKYPEAKGHKHYVYISKLIEEKKLLAKLNTTENSLIPYQLHKVELERILNNQGIHHPFLAKNKGLILKVLESRIPYYIGPLNPDSQFAWVDRNNTDKGVYPWNYEEYVNVDKTAEEFIKRMTNKCTYLYEKDVLPRYSLIYSEFVLLNELNKVRINGKPIDKITKREIIEHLFKTRKTVKTKDLSDWIRKNPKGFIQNVSDEIKIEGTQKENEFAASLAPYIDFEKILGEKVNESNIPMIEEIITWITIFEDKEILRRKIKQREDFYFDDATMEKLLRLRYKGWARLSEELIDGITNNRDSNSLGQTILDIMRKTNYNFMQIINEPRFDFKNRMEEINGAKDKNRIDYDDVKNLYGSPAIKRGIWQAVRIIREIVYVMGCEPEHIFLEVARSDEESKRTSSRVKNIEEIYKTIRKDVEMYNKEVYENLQHFMEENNKLDDRALFLYFTQNGKCMYTGEQLDPHNLSKYQVDHIIPRCFIKDDSLDNVALVKTKENQLKRDNLLLSPEIRSKQAIFWDNLYKYGLITKKKLDNLNRTYIPDREVIGFINRQLVETRQIIKHTADLLSEAYENTKIMSVKTRLVSDFREKYGLYKNRDLNDLHHAHDALIVSIIGNFTIRRFPNLEDEMNIKKYINWFKTTNSYIGNKGKYGFILSSMDNDYSTSGFVWESDYEAERVKKALNYKDCFVVKKVETQTGKFYDESIYPSKHAKASIPRKNGLDPKKYGGHNSENNSYYAVIEYLNKGKKVKKLVGIPIYIAYKEDNVELRDYLIASEDIKDAGSLKIIKDQIKKYQLIEYEGQQMYLVSHTELQNAVQLIVDDKYKQLLYMISKNQDLSILDNCDDLMITFIDYYIEKINKHYPLYRKTGEKINASREEFSKFPMEEKVEFIKQMLKVTSVGSMNGKFKRFGTKIDSDEEGRMRNRSKSGWDINKISFIDKSITGAFERSYKL